MGGGIFSAPNSPFGAVRAIRGKRGNLKGEEGHQSSYIGLSKLSGLARVGGGLIGREPSHKIKAVRDVGVLIGMGAYQPSQPYHDSQVCKDEVYFN